MPSILWFTIYLVIYSTPNDKKGVILNWKPSLQSPISWPNLYQILKSRSVSEGTISNLQTYILPNLHRKPSIYQPFILPNLHFAKPSNYQNFFQITTPFWLYCFSQEKKWNSFLPLSRDWSWRFWANFWPLQHLWFCCYGVRFNKSEQLFWAQD